MKGMLYERLKWFVYITGAIIAVAMFVFYPNSTILCNIGCSVLASVCIATLMDIADYVKQKKVAAQQRSYLLSEYKNSVDELIGDILEQVRYTNLDCSIKNAELPISEWLDLLFDEKSCQSNDNESVSNESNPDDLFEWTASFISRVEKAANYLSSQSPVLLITNTLGKDDLAFFKSQSINCRSVERYCKRKDAKRIKRGILNILRKHSKHFSENDLLQKTHSIY